MANHTTANGGNTSDTNATGTEQQPGTERKPASGQQQLVEEKWNQIRSAIKAKWPQLNDQDLEMIDGDSRKLVALVHQKTQAPLHEIEEGIDAIAAQSEGLLSRIARSAGEFAQSAGQYAQSAGSHIAAPVQRAYSQTRGLVEARPFPSIASSFAAGMLVGIVAYAMAIDDR